MPGERTSSETLRKSHQSRISLITVLALCALACGCEPSDRTPGLWLRGEVVDPPPADWGFTDEHKEIYVEVATPYFLPHSVTIWCAEVDGRLYIGARDAATKNWPGWLEAERDIRLKIGASVYPVTAVDIDDADVLDAVRAAYEVKYDLAPGDGGAKRNVTYWAIAPRGSAAS